MPFYENSEKFIMLASSIAQILSIKLRCAIINCKYVYCNRVMVKAIWYANIRYMLYFISFVIFVINSKRVNHCLIVISWTINAKISEKSRLTTKSTIFKLSSTLLKYFDCWVAMKSWWSSFINLSIKDWMNSHVLTNKLFKEHLIREKSTLKRMPTMRSFLQNVH